MSQTRRLRPPTNEDVYAPVFAALGDELRLKLLVKLAAGTQCSIAELTGSQAGRGRVTRQAITKHLRVLERAGIVHGERVGRESRFVFNPARLQEAKEYLDGVSKQWDEALGRLKELVESSE